MLKLGDRVRCKISGFEGIVNSRTEWLYGCIRLGVLPEKLKDHKPVNAEVFDEEQLVLVEKSVISRTQDVEKNVSNGGDCDDISRTGDISRVS